MFAASKTAAAAAGTPPASTDPQFRYVSLLLNDTGTNGQQNNTFLDSSTNNFTITRNGTPTQGSVTPYWPDGQWSNYFGGTGQGTRFANSTAFNLTGGAYTIEFWVNPASYTSEAVLIGQNDYGTMGEWDIRIRTTGNIRVAYNSTGASTIDSLAPITRGAWTHVAVIDDGSQTILYINGVQQGTSTTRIASSTRNLGVGCASNWNAPLTGYLSNVRIVKGTALYSGSSFTPPTTPLTAVSGTSLLTCQSNRFKDNSSNNFAITVNGTPQVTAFDPFSPAASYSTGTYGGSGYFNGTSDKLTIANNAAFQFGTGDYTFECWLYQTNSASYRRIVALGDYVAFSANGNWGVEVTSGNVLVHNNGYYITFSAGIKLNTWTHLAVVRSSGSVSVFVNGVQVGSAQSQSGNINSTASLGIGSEPGGTTYWYGYLSNLRMVKGTAVYTANFTPPTAPVTAIPNTSLLLNFTNAGIYDAATLNDLVTVGDAKVSTAVAKFGSSSMAFDGTGDYLSYAGGQSADMGTGSFTIEFWMYATSITSQMNILATGGAFGTGASRIGKDGIFGMALYTRTTVDNVIVSEGSNTFINGAANQWVHYAFVRNGNSFTLYRNGTSVSTATYTGSISFNLNGSTVIGTDWANDYFTGYLDDLRITKGYARYTANFTPPTAPFPTR